MPPRLALLVLLSILVCGCFPSALHGSNPPGIIHHQGRLSISGVNHDGSGYFKFAFVDGAGTTSYWSNDGTSSGGGEPASAVKVTVARGHYAVPLGDTTVHANMTNAIPANVFADHDDVRLRIWFATAVGGPFEPFSPDQRVTSAGYALSASKAQSVADMAITEGMLADGSVTTAKLAPGSVNNTVLAPGAAGENIDAEGALGIGLGGATPLAAVHLDGEVGFPDPALLAAVVDEVGGFNKINGASSVFVSGTTAYVASQYDDSLTIIDVSNPAAPSVLAEVVDGTGGFNVLSGARSVFVSGTTAYVVSVYDHSLTIINVSNPAAPSLLAEVVDGLGGFSELAEPTSVYVSGSTAYVTSSGDSALTIIDVSNPAAPSLLAEVVTDIITPLNSANSVVVAGTTAYVASSTGDSLTVFNVSNPAAPVVIARRRDGIGGFNALNGASSVFVSGSTAYVASYWDDSLTIIDVSNPAAPSLLAEIVDGFGGFNALDGANFVHISGTTAYVASVLDSALTLIDVSNPAAPTLLAEVVDGVGGFDALNGARSVTVSGSTSYVASREDNSLTVIDTAAESQVDVATTNRVGIGTTRPVAMLHVEGDAFVAGSLLDTTQEAGSGGQVLASTGSGTEWTNLLDNDPTNELQTLSPSGSNLTLSDGGGTVSINDADANATNELQSLSRSVSTLTLSNGGGSVSLNDSDADPSNELQTLSLGGDSLSLSPSGGSVSLNRYLRSDINDTFTGGTLSINGTLDINNNTFVDSSAWLVVNGILDVNSTLRVDSNAVHFNNATEYLSFNPALSRFEISDDLRVQGTVSAEDDISIGTGSGSDADYLRFDAGAEHLVWNNFEGRFELSSNLKIDGNLFVGNLFVENQIVWGDTNSPGFGQPALQLRSDATLVFMMDDDNTSATTDQFEWYEDGGTLAANKLMELQPDGDLRIRGVLRQSENFDIAESFYMTEPLQPGELVRVDPARSNGVRRSTGAADETILGVVSANPGFLLGGAGFDEGTLEVWGPGIRNRYREEFARLTAEVLARDPELVGNPSLHKQRVMEHFFSRHFAKIALAGRVPVKVDTRHGAIQPGDRLTASPVPGVAMKATGTGPTIGVALEGFSAGEGTVLTFIQSGWHEGTTSTNTRIRNLESALRTRDELIQSLERRLSALEKRSEASTAAIQPN